MKNNNQKNEDQIVNKKQIILNVERDEIEKNKLQ